MCQEPYCVTHMSEGQVGGAYSVNFAPSTLLFLSKYLTLLDKNTYFACLNQLLYVAFLALTFFTFDLVIKIPPTLFQEASNSLHKIYC